MAVKKRELFGEMMEGVRAMRAPRRSHYVAIASHRPLTLPSIDEAIIRTTRERLHMSQCVAHTSA
jgi:hypothetical protein